MPHSMAQEQSGGVRRRSLESPMKEAQARTKVVLRHLPPSMPQAVLLEYIDSKFPGCYTWFSYRPGKASMKKQILSRAYINFKKAEDVYDFCEDFDGHVFVNEKGTQYKVTVEYAPYQQTPKPRSKKDIREGTITKDPDYLEFLEVLGKPLEYLPSAEVQLERREAEKAAALGASGGKEAVVVTPLMEFVRQRRAAKAAPQRLSSSKLAARSGVVSVATSNLASHKRGLTSRSGLLMDFKEVQARDHTGGHRRDEQQQRKERDVSERRKKEMIDAKDKKLINESFSTAISAVKGNAATVHQEASKHTAHVTVPSKDSMEVVTAGELKAIEALGVNVEPLSSHLPVTVKPGNDGMLGDAAKDLNKREVGKRKQLMVLKEKVQKDSEIGPASPGQVAGAGHNAYSQRHRPPVSPRVTSASVQPQLATSGDGSIVVALSKPNQRRDLPGRNSSRGVLSPRDHQSPSQQHVASHGALLLDSQSQQGSPQSERGGKRPPRPQNARLTGKEQVQVPTIALPTEFEVGSLSNSSSLSPIITEDKLSNTSVVESFSAAERQDSRRVRNKDRPDRPVWTPRRRSDAVQSPDPSSSVPSAESTSATLLSDVPDFGESSPKVERTERGLQRPIGKVGSNTGQISVEAKVTEVRQGTGQQPEGGRSQLGPGSVAAYNSVSGKARYVESGSARSARGARSSPGNGLVNQEQTVASQGEQKSDSFVSGAPTDPKAPQISLYNPIENGDSHAAEKEKRKQDVTPQWNDVPGGSHRSGERRRERSVQHGSKDNDGSGAAAELTKPVKRGGSTALGSNEKQVWVAVQKAGSGT